ncbi:L-histidine N(alpha)-methyltransferase [Actinoplanes sp. NEAU-A12]|uniref:L-histidine N(Alpha)-methyltransferase n=1 Tax=Actinoplanes sandaracinus TaxID=3045177 RepID=A0ABT6WMB3_9ACTN|nr:L-histidine N(alpha)-methyltransferase [Actinoplanes sandaracinus]MDI6100831.1 L-histidine N(alpha)-methyltransferase [Actinoplanes sandaracinus]
MPDTDDRVVSPREQFYRVFSPAQADTLAEVLTGRREFPQEFTYLGDGAALWRASTEGIPHQRAAPTQEYHLLLRNSAAGLLAHGPADTPVEVIDLGPGTGRPARALLHALVAAGRFAGYRGIDISTGLLDLAARNLRAWFPGEAARLEFRHGDFTGPDLAGVLPARPGGGPGRFVLLTGGTVFNMAEPEQFLRRVGAALSPADLLVLTVRFDVGFNRPAFLDHVEAGAPLLPIHQAAVDLLNLDPRWYETERGFDPGRSEVWTGLRFRRPVTIRIDGASGPHAVAFEAGERMLVYRYRLLDRAGVIELLTRSGLTTILFDVGTSGEVALVAAVTGANS